jgi:threonine dehydratase
MEAKSPGTKVHSVEPAGFDDYARSLRSGRIEKNPKASGSICDALMSPSPGEMTFAINSRLLGGGLAVTDAEAAEAVRFAFEVLKLVVEPGGAVALAAVLSRKIAIEGRTVGVIASGGNCDSALYARILRREI